MTFILTTPSSDTSDLLDPLPLGLVLSSLSDSPTITELCSLIEIKGIMRVCGLELKFYRAITPI